MKKNYLLLLISIAFLFTACNFFSTPINGNGNLSSETRNISSAQKIKLAGNYNVELSQGNTSLKINTDENLLSYIETYNENGWLVIKTKEHYRLSSSNPIKIIISTDKLEAIKLAGSGNITGTTKFTGGDMLEIAIAGSGNATLEVNTPKVKSSIAGSGDIILSGETKDEEIHIAGHGNYKAINLKSENADVHIAGSGNANVFAANKLSIHIAGSGDVNYKGNPAINKEIVGSGNIKKIAEN
ncbi:MAG: DUF2807 domain-containing protein [Bacteroidetes bacterium]|nr:DUF2807 domain-containing protein [Bacteroidota bacterium]MBS1642898.1 DUF2807 domain-containing protein [Bacteroidota bacterium]MBS1671874.1 DUF2807 domain-containing protein [Bacteroidota bacterium]